MMPSSALPWRERILNALSRLGGDVAMGDLERELGATKNTVRKHLQPLIDEGLVEPVAHGRYRLTGDVPLPSEEGRELLAALEELGYDAHLTGFDLLAPHAHQFVFSYPHLVYAEPTAFDALTFELPQRGFVVVPAGRGPKASGPDPARMVVLRRQPDPERYGVRGHVAPTEKAWVDALRETRRGNLDLSYMELGRILRSLLDDGADVRYLRRYARHLGYLGQLDRVISGEVSDPGVEDADALALRAGFTAA
jgi:DNA-binding MarR family transcriptional regulator